MKCYILIVVLGVAFSIVNSKDEQTRILDGTVAGYDQFRYMVSIQHTAYLTQVPQAHVCGGALITYSHVLTAGTCVSISQSVVGSPSQYRVFYGNDLYQTDSINDRVRSVSNITRHPSYVGPSNYIHDIAVLRLSTPFSTRVQPLTLTSNVQFPDNTVCYLAGYGSPYSGNPASNVLRYAEKVITNHYQCQTMYFPLTTVASVLPTMKCAVSRFNQMSCYGDNGGPLVCNGQLAGLLIVNNQCTLSPYPEVYTAVTDYYTWIANVTSSGYRTEISVITFFTVIWALL